MDVCTAHELPAALGEPVTVPCARVVPGTSSRGVVAPTLAVVAAIEAAVRGSPGDDWAADVWDALRPHLSSAATVRPGPSGTIVAAWPCTGPQTPADVAAVALSMRDAVRERPAGRVFELRGGVEIGVIDASPESHEVERSAERLALAAGDGQWLVAAELARVLEAQFDFRSAGLVPRWPVDDLGQHRALIGRLRPPRLPSAVHGEPPQVVIGRESERRRLRRALGIASGHGHRVIVITAPAGGGKSYLLRRVLADTNMPVLGGVAFPPLGAGPVEPIRSLLAELDYDGEAGATTTGQLGTRLAEAARAAAGSQPGIVVVDDVHWADAGSVAALRTAIEHSVDGSVVWLLSTRTAALPALAGLADATVRLPPLNPRARLALLESHMQPVPDIVRAHVATGDERGNPLYLDHLAALVTEDDASLASLPGSLHEVVLTRLDRLVERARSLTRWPVHRIDSQSGIEDVEREIGDWLDRLETADLAELATVGRYLAKLRAADVELIIARSLLMMPSTSNRRLTQAIERLAAASTDALLDHLATVADAGRAKQAAYEASAAAQRAERNLRLADAERLTAFACERGPDDARLLVKRGDLALALGRAACACASYKAAARSGAASAELERRTARAEATAGDVAAAMARVRRLLDESPNDPGLRLSLKLDHCRLSATPPPAGEAPSAAVRRRRARTESWVREADRDLALRAARALVLDGAPVACAAELVETTALVRLAGVEIAGLHAAAEAAARALGNPNAHALLSRQNGEAGRHTFLHWDV